MCCAAPLSAAAVALGLGAAAATFLVTGLWAVAGLLLVGYLAVLVRSRRRRSVATGQNQPSAVDLALPGSAAAAEQANKELSR